MCADKNMDDSNTDSEDDPITLIDYEQRRFGCYAINKKACDKSDHGKLHGNQNLNYEKFVEVGEKNNKPCPSVKKRYQCCPVSIKLVDCAKFPWYYKFNQRLKSLENRIDLDEEQDEIIEISSDSDVDDLICLNPMCLNNKVMHDSNEYISKCTESPKGIYDKRDSQRISTTGNVDFKKNIGLIGMRIRCLSANNFRETSDKQDNYETYTKSMNFRDLPKAKSPIKDVIATGKPVLNENVIGRTKTSQSNFTENIHSRINKETSYIYHDDCPFTSYSECKKSLSPVLKLNVGIKKPKNRVANLNTNVTEKKDKTYNNTCLKINNDSKYFKDASPRISKRRKSSINKSNNQNYKFLSNIEFRSKSPIFLLKNNRKKKIPRSEICNDCQSSTNYENKYLNYLKGNVTQRQNSELEIKQINIFNKGNKKIQLPVSIKLDNIIEQLHKKKLPQKDIGVGSNITNLEYKLLQPKNCNNKFEDIDNVSINTPLNTTHKENKINNNLSFENRSHTRSFITSEPQHFSLQNFNCDFRQLVRYDKVSPHNSECGHQNLYQAATSGPVIRHKIPHKHIRVPTELLNSTNQPSPCTYIPKQTISLEENNRTEISRECGINNGCIMEGTVLEPKYDTVNLKSVLGIKGKSDKEFFEQKVERNGYSPPILPIPTYQTTFEYLTSFSTEDPKVQNINQFSNQIVLDPNSKSLHSKYCNTDFSGWKDLFEKRKVNTTESNSKKKISLKEYKMRVDELGHASFGKSIRNEQCRSQDGNLYPGPCGCLKNTPNLCLQFEDVGYDSDQTLIL